MDWLSHAVMVSRDGFTPEYSPIQPTILKSKSTSLDLWQSLTYNHRVVLASIRDKGRCPCPRCLVPLNKVHNLGTATDMKQREKLARVDDVNRRKKVETARDIIYHKNYAVNNEASEALLKEESYAATRVSSQSSFAVVITYQQLLRTRSPKSLALTDSTILLCS